LPKNKDTVEKKERKIENILFGLL